MLENATTWDSTGSFTVVEVFLFQKPGAVFHRSECIEMYLSLFLFLSYVPVICSTQDDTCSLLLDSDDKPALYAAVKVLLKLHPVYLITNIPVPSIS